MWQVKDTNSLFHGDHTRSISNPTPSTGGMMRFAKVTLKCLGCKTPITDAQKTLCEHCQVIMSAVRATPLVTRRAREEY